MQVPMRTRATHDPAGRCSSQPGPCAHSMVLWSLLILLTAGGCGTMRVTDPQRTATEQFLMSQAVDRAVEKLAAAPLRDRKVYVDSAYLTGSRETSAEHLFLLGELRSRLLLSGVRLVNIRDQAQIILEVR